MNSTPIATISPEQKENAALKRELKELKELQKDLIYSIVTLINHLKAC